MKRSQFFCFAAGLFALVNGNKIASAQIADPDRFADVLDYKGVPRETMPDGSHFTVRGFSDAGAWHAFALPSEPAYYGGFTGPLVVETYGRWLSPCLHRLELYDNGGDAINLASARQVRIWSTPGALHQNFDLDELQVTLELRFVSDRTALISATLANTSTKRLSIRAGWSGDLTYVATDSDRAPALIAQPSGLGIRFQNDGAVNDPVSSTGNAYHIVHGDRVATNVKGNHYSIALADVITLRPAQSRELHCAHTYTLTAQEWNQEREKLNSILLEPARYITSNRKRWNGYLAAALTGVPQDEPSEVIAVKSVQTLVGNWMSPAESIPIDAVAPSMWSNDFHGVWSWDSWKQAVALVFFDPELAQRNIRAMFAFQNARGMVLDCVGAIQNGSVWNARNTKPPLAAWAVWNVYEQTRDRTFLRALYTGDGLRNELNSARRGLVAYHKWWYAYRNHEQGDLCQYGATDDPHNHSDRTRLQAAKWESGMDNAVRFDADWGIRVLSNSNGEYSIDQHSVDLNAYLFAEKRYLTLIARELGLTDDASAFEQEAQALGKRIRETMFDETSGFFYDTSLSDGLPLINRGRGPEGWIPLWAGLATPQQAQRVRDVVMNPDEFNTYLPFPTAARSNPRFDATAYWRGPVWLDQAYFGVVGLARYGFTAEADELAQRLLLRTEGLSVRGPQIRENYDPLNGAGLSSFAFSWSAAFDYLLVTKRYL